MTVHPRALLVLGLAGLLSTACGGAVSDTADAGSGGSALAKNCPDNATTGVTDTTLKLGVSQPLSGPLVAVGAQLYGMQAYFRYANAQGGIKGPDGKARKVELIAKDDAYTATKAKANVEQLIGDDKVFALIGQFGTAGNLAARPVIAKECVPSLFATTGAPELANPRYPWQVAGSISYSVEARILGQYLKQTKPDATVAVLEQDDDLGRAYLQGFEQGIKGSNIKIVKKVTFESTDPDVNNQITTLAATKADVFFNVAIGLSALQSINHVASSGWKPQIIQAAQVGSALLAKLQPGAGDGLIIGSPSLDLANPANQKGEEYQLFLKWFRSTPATAKIDPTTASQGWWQGRMFEWVVRHAAKMDRPSVMEATRNLTYTGPSFTLPGVKMTITPQDTNLIEGMRLQRFNRAKGLLEPFGDVIDIDGTVPYEPVR
ncbi:ABC transporter substrate-binding protein [Actinomadura rugatobispora]|uniref:ABC transporter substrate-binding protein n=1 Tax=Actinomadura rugatobispora TaxID=1994 RepID=A0ABW1ACK1_9ACTN|nr:ABC transporter substrate-binding protein [Actinomadura rugatobispora]